MTKPWTCGRIICSVRARRDLILSGIGFLALAGCSGPGGLARPWKFQTQHPAVRWIYAAGWQTVFFAPPGWLPLVFPLSNDIRKVTLDGDSVVIVENAVGDFGSGLYQFVVRLDLGTGATKSKLACDVEMLIAQPEAPREDVVYRIGNGLHLSWHSQPNLRVVLSRGPDPEKDPALVLQRRNVGWVGPWLWIPGQNLLLLKACTREGAYLICIDVTRL